jgi:alpha-glucosidase (family GH31 glycosyl hydrolase)
MISRKIPELLALLILCVAIVTVSSQTYLGNYTGYSVSGKQITVYTDTSSVRFIFYQSDLLRVDFLPSLTGTPDSSFVAIQDTTKNVVFNIIQTSSTLEIETSALKIVCQKDPLRISYQDAGGEAILSEPASGGLAINGDERWAVFSLTPGDHFYGTGERGTGLDKKGLAFDSYNTQIFSYHDPLETMNINVPFLASSKGYALYFDNTYPGHFDLGASDPNRFLYKALGGELTYYLMIGKTIPDQLGLYTWLTGRQPLPPRWAFGYIQSKYGYRNENEARAMVQTMRQKEIPGDAIVLDLYWFEYMGDISWNYSDWPNPEQMMQDFLADGFKTIVITEPYIIEHSTNFPDAIANGYFAHNSLDQPYLFTNWWSCNCDAGLLDISNPEAQTWWWNKHPAFFGNYVAGIWTDLGEPERHDPEMLHHLGSRDKVHNIYNFLWQKTIYEGYASFRPNQRLFNLTRAGFAGIQRFGVIPWSGDVGTSFGGLAVQLPMMLNMGLSGLAYHHSDIGGFCCDMTSPELYVRWMQHSTFSPIARAHGADYQPQEPWGYGLAAEDIARKFIEIRYQLLPYIYTLAYMNYKTGMPLARPLFFLDPDNPNLLDHSSSYLWGDAFLVSPVVQAGITSKSVYLPSGKWIDYWDDQVYSGDQNIIVSAPLEKMPIFVKAGSIIPMQPVMNYSNEHPLDTLILTIYPSGEADGQFTLYEDDGETLDYQTGGFALTHFTQTNSGSGVNTNLNIGISAAQGAFNGMLTNRVYFSDLHNIFSKPSVVSENGVPVTEKISFQQLRQDSHGFYYDSLENRLYIQTPASVDSGYSLIVSNVMLASEIPDKIQPKSFQLLQNYPNPFNASTKIRYSIGNSVFVTLKVYDILGRQVVTLVNERQSAGSYEAVFNADNLKKAPLASGLYFYKISAGSYSEVKQMLLMK